MANLILLTVFIVFFNIINAYRKRNFKIITIILLILMWIIYFGSIKNPDYENYVSNYLSTNPGNDYGYYLIKNLFSSHSIKYNYFLAFYSLVGLLLINNTVKKFCDNSSYVYILYFIYPFLLDVVQVRNFMAMAILVFSVPYLMSIKKKDYVKYIILILIAATFQLTAIVYLPMVLIPLIKDYKFNRRIVFFVIISIISLSFNKHFLQIIGIIFRNISDDSRLEFWLQAKAKYGFLLYWFMQFSNYLLIRWCRKIIDKKVLKSEILSDNNEKKKRFIELTYRINIYAFVFLPFYKFHSTFTRFMRNLSILNLVVYSICNYKLKSGSLKKLIFNIVIIAYSLFLFYVEIYLSYSNTIVKSIFENNMLIR